MKVELFPFQKRAVADLRMKAAVALNTYRNFHIPQVLSLQAPTGAGKTIIMAAFIEDVLFGTEQFTEQPEAIFVWLSDSPALNEQSKQKIDLKADKIRFNQCITIEEDSFDQEMLDDGHIYFLNTQKLSVSGKLGKHYDKRQHTIWETLENTAREMIYQKEAETVKEIFRLYTEEGQSISYIAKKLNDENIQREQRGNVKISGFTDRTVRIILSNPVYAGMISYGRRHTVKVEGKNNETKVVKQDDESKIILVDGVHEPIVSKETFAKAAERLKKNVAHRKTRSDSTTVYPLTGLIRCPDCGKTIFGYTAPPRKKKNGKEGYYPRYISYRCISGRDRNGISCSLANKYYSGTKLETEVKEVISSMVTIPEFVELISQKIDIQTDVNSLRKKRAAIQNEITKYNGNLLQTEKRLTELDIADRHYQNKVDSLNRILDDLYEKIEDAQTRLDEVNQEITMVEKSAMTKKSIFEMLEGFSKYYDVMSPEDKKALLQAMVSFIELYPEKRDDKHLIKTIHFTFPVTYDGESGALFVRTNEQQVETVCLLSKP